MKKCVFIAMVLMLFLWFTIPANAEVRTFGFDDNRTRVATGTESVLWPTWYDNSGESFSQPLILGGWDTYAGKTLVVAVTGNHLRGYVCEAPAVMPNEFGFMQNNPLWSIALEGSNPTHSHPTLVEKDGRKYIYIGTARPGYLHIIDISDFSKAFGVYSFEDAFASDIVSAPLVLNWHEHEVVVYTAGNTGTVNLAINPMAEGKSNNIQIQVGTGRTSSTPAPVLGGQGFVVGLDRGASASGVIKVYRLDDILEERNGKVVGKGSVPAFEEATEASVISSFSTSGNRIYFGDNWSRVYGFDLDKGDIWINDDNVGKFSNRSPALTPNTVYFPSSGRDSDPGRLLSVDRNTGDTNWIVDFDTPAQAAPIVWTYSGGATVITGTYGGYLALIDAYNYGEKYQAISVAPAGGTCSCMSSNCGGVSGEISAYDNWLVISTVHGVMAWYAQPMDIEIVSIDPGCPQEGGKYKAQVGERYTATAVVRAPQMHFDDLAIPVAAFNEITYGIFEAPLLRDGSEIPRSDAMNNNQVVYFGKPGEEVLVQFDWTAYLGAQYLTVAANIDYPLGAAQLRNHWPESTFENNRLSVPIETQGYDVKIQLKPQNTAYTAISDTVAVYCDLIVTRTDRIPGNLEVTVTATGGGYNFSQNITLSPGQSTTQVYSFPAAPGTHTLRGEAWPDGVKDIHPSDNRDSATIRVIQAEIPQGDMGIRVGL